MNPSAIVARGEVNVERRRRDATSAKAGYPNAGQTEFRRVAEVARLQRGSGLHERVERIYVDPPALFMRIDEVMSFPGGGMMRVGGANTECGIRDAERRMAEMEERK